MKTREELLKEMNRFRRQMLDDKQSEIVKRGVQEILNAPTQEQLDCPYCHGGRKAKPIVETSSDFLAFDKNGIVAFGNDGSVMTGEDYTKFKYCPMCSRKLSD